MAQDFILGWISGHLRGTEAEKVRAALARMKLQDVPAEWDTLRWELLDWFVVFAQRAIAALTDEQCSHLDEEVQVVQLLAACNMNPWVPNREDLKALQRRVFRILSDLIEKGSARIGPLPVEFIVYRGTIKQKDLPAAQHPKGVFMVGGLPCLVGHPPSEGIAFQVPPSGADALIHALAQLLSKYPGAVRQCPHPDCKKLFAQFRSSAEYCSRTCQSRMFSRKQWAERKAQAKDKMRGATKQQPKKGGRAHGEKTR